jgi:membrane protease subunit HflC
LLAGHGAALGLHAVIHRLADLLGEVHPLQAQAIKGEGDARAAAIYAEAYGKNPEFYAFYRSMDAYKQTFRNKSDVLVLDPSSQFFKYLKNPGAGAKATQ